MLTSEMLDQMMKTMLSTPPFDANNPEHIREMREGAKKFTAMIEAHQAMAVRPKRKRRRSL